MSSSGMSARAWGLFAAVSVVWGIPYLFIKLAVEDLSPIMVAFGRISVAFAVLLPYAIRRGALRGLGRHWKPLLVYSLVELVLPWPLIGFGEQRVSSGLAAILIAAVPLVIALIALRIDPDERAEGVRLAGLVLGFAGVVVLLGVDVAGRPGELLGAMAVLLATVGYAIGPMIVKHRFGELDPLGPVTASMGISALVLLPAAAVSTPSSMPSGQTLLSVLVLGLACSALAFLLFFALIGEVGPSRASVITYVNPVVAVALGVALLGEGLGPSAVAGLLLILAGSWLSTGGRMPPGVMMLVSPRRRRAAAAAGAAGPSSPARATTSTV
jgi:drug/metabolite transporter (DMT)-like permease